MDGNSYHRNKSRRIGIVVLAGLLSAVLFLMQTHLVVDPVTEKVAGNTTVKIALRQKTTENEPTVNTTRKRAKKNGSAAGKKEATSSFTANETEVSEKEMSEDEETTDKLEKEAGATMTSSPTASQDDDVPRDKWEKALWTKLTRTKILQIENYRNETALMLNIHPTHHGGTSFCTRIGRNGIHGGIAPKFACMGDKDGVMPDPSDRGCSGPFCVRYEDMQRFQMPWSHEQTGPFATAIRPYFHMMSWEFGTPKVKSNHTLDSPDWDHPNLLSVVITRDPLSRLLAGDGIMHRTYPGYQEPYGMSRSRWWDYAVYKGETGTDNFFLRILASLPLPRFSKEQKLISNHAEEGIERTTQEVMDLFPTGIGEAEFQHAKSVLDNFTIVLDIACLTEGMEALGRLLRMDLPPLQKSSKHKPGQTPREQIAYEDVYDYLVAKNQWDIALYEYSKTISLVRCEELV